MKLLIVSVLMAVTAPCLSQDFPRQDIDLGKLADEIFPIQDLDLNYEELYENLAQLMANPIDLNAVTREQLRSLFVLTEQEIHSFFEYREKNGPLLSVYELQTIPNWDHSTFDKVIPFVTVADPQSRLNGSILQRLSRAQSNYLVVRYDKVLEPKAVYDPETDSARRYAGSPDHLYIRYRLARSNDFSIGFTMEKDAGESIIWSPAHQQYGFDFISLHAQALNKGRLKNLIIGDYQTQFGQGLVLGSVFGFGKNSETVTTVRRSNLGFMPYTSLNENQFFRGIAASFAISKYITFHGFASHLFRDGALNESEDQSFFSSFSTTGLHRTLAELSSRKQIGETNFGGVLQFRNSNLDAGIVLHQVAFTAQLQKNPTPYNQFSFNGLQNQSASLYVNYSFANFTFFSEAAYNMGGGSALVAGLMGSMTPKLETSLLVRDFSKDYFAPTSNAFSENTVPQNERGLYWGLKYKFNKRYSSSGYIDLFQFPWLRYRGYAPSEGSEWLLRFTYTPLRNTELFIQAREETKIRNLSAPASLYRYENGVKRSYWINCDYAAVPFSFKSRVQFSNYQLGNQVTGGFALIQDAALSLSRWTFSFRYALFGTDDYDNRQYVYEKDVWLAYSFPAYYGVGIRKFAIVQFALSKKVDLWLRWSQIQYEDRSRIGSGGEAIAGNTRNDVKFQVRVQF